jgi:hypothetical protein
LALRDHDINAFARVVSEVKVNFVLITLTTLNIPGSLNAAEVAKIAGSPRLKAWYTQNYDDSKPGGKMLNFPLGIDYHTLAGTTAQQKGVGGTTTFGMDKGAIPAAKQDAKVKELYSNAAEWSSRPNMLYVGAYAPTHTTRKGASFKAIPKRISGVLHVTGRKSRWEMIRQLASSKFVLAPRGLGMESIRFYEAAMVGSIPICDKLGPQSMNELHKKFGAIIVDSWDEVNDENLAAWAKAIETKDYESRFHTAHLANVNPKVLTTRFWLECVASGVDCLSLVR